MSKSPAFRFYPADFMGSPDVQAMELHEVGAYLYLLFVAWQSERHGYLPDDDEKLRRWARMTREQWRESREILLSKFPIVEVGWRANPRMVIEAEKQQRFSASQSFKGRKGGRPKKNPGLSEEKPELLSGKPGESQTKAHEKPSVSVSVSEEEKNLSPSGDPRPSSSNGRDSWETVAVKEVFSYYLTIFGRNGVTYTLTKARLKVGTIRLRECLAKCGQDSARAILMMKAGVDGLAKDDWCCGRDPKTNGKRYIEWEANLMKEAGQFEKRIEDGTLPILTGDGQRRRFTDPSALYSGPEYQSSEGAA